MTCFTKRSKNFIGGILFSMICLIGNSSTLFSQTHEGFCGTSIISDSLSELAWQNTLQRSPGIVEAVITHKLMSGAPSNQVGTQELFWTFNFEKNQFDTVRAELMATGTTSYVWVALSEWNNNRIRSTEVNIILEALENKTPRTSRDSTKGILRLVKQFFGNPPNISPSFVKGGGDGKTHFLIYDIKDGAKVGGTYVKGYFHRNDVDGNSSSKIYSNKRDILYIDSYPGIYGFDGTRDATKSLDALPHEFQHLIHWNYDPNEIKFFNEGLSEYASFLCGYELRSPSDYLKNPNVSLLAWDNSLADYARAGYWTLYLGTQLGDTFLKNFTQHGATSIEGFDAAAIQSSLAIRFVGAIENFFVRIYTYSVLDPSSTVRLLRDYLGAIGGTNRPTLQPYGVDYVRYRLVDSVRIIFLTSSPTIKIKGNKKTDTGTSIFDIQPGVMNSSNFVGSKASELALIIFNNQSAGPISYSFASEGRTRTSSILELAYDDGRTLRPPNTSLRQNDTVFVHFDGVYSAKIDSVRMWFESLGAASLMISDANPNYDLSSQPLSGLGGKSRMPSGTIPFLVSNTNFFGTSVDLTQHSISASPDFVVQIIYGPGAPEPRLRRDSSQAIVRSYLSLASQPTSGRVMYSSTGDFYIRVYLSSTDAVPPEPVIIPEKFVLQQNFPNPFNQSTLIKYEINKKSWVKLAVYDMLGREVAVLVDEEQLPYFYEVRFRPDRFPSGVFYYRLNAGELAETKKMIYLK